MRASHSHSLSAHKAVSDRDMCHASNNNSYSNSSSSSTTANNRPVVAFSYLPSCTNQLFACSKRKKEPKETNKTSVIPPPVTLELELEGEVALC